LAVFAIPGRIFDANATSGASGEGRAGPHLRLPRVGRSRHLFGLQHIPLPGALSENGTSASRCSSQI
jgi:hypothetical protein